MHKSNVFLVGAAVMILMAGSVNAQSNAFGIRAGLGTDISLGLAYGVGINYVLVYPQSSLELGVIYFGGSFDETTDEGIHTYEETTDLGVFGFMVNYLINYQPRKAGMFYIAGIGLASVYMEWEERSSTDESLGTPLPGGGSIQSEEGSGAGMTFNFGIGGIFSSGVDIRLELPFILTFAAPGGASSVIPTLIVTLGYRF